MTVQISCIVEGHGEVKAVPNPDSTRRCESLSRISRLAYLHPIRVSRSKVIQEGELERAVEFAARKIGGQGAIFILLDSDDDCPARLGPELLCRALEVRGDLPIAVVLAKREFEAWFLAAAESLQGQRGLKNNLQPPNNPEAIHGAKEWLSQRMDSETEHIDQRLDQPGLTDSL